MTHPSLSMPDKHEEKEKEYYLITVPINKQLVLYSGSGNDSTVDAFEKHVSSLQIKNRCDSTLQKDKSHIKPFVNKHCGSPSFLPTLSDITTYRIIKACEQKRQTIIRSKKEMSSKRVKTKTVDLFITTPLSILSCTV